MQPPNETLPASIPPNAPTIGVGRYVLTARIAEGGMAVVYRAWDHKLRVWRAVKVLLPDYAQREVLRDRFEAEAKTMAKLDHPNVVRVVDVGTKEALPYMVMELEEGGTVNTWLETYGCMSARRAVDVVSDVAKGLAAAHALGVVHRDVKPQNLLVSPEGLCKVTDFGIAHGALELGLDHTKTGATMGTIGYMAPEQRENAKIVDVRADVYSLGAVLYKLVVGKVMTDLFLVEHEPHLLDDVPELLREVIVHACYHDRSRRYPNAAALIRALGEIRELLPFDPPDTPPLPMVARETQFDEDFGFPEIEVLLTGIRRTAAPIPYTMSRPAGARRSYDADVEDVPDYVVPDHPPSEADSNEGGPVSLPDVLIGRTPLLPNARVTPRPISQRAKGPNANRSAFSSPAVLRSLTFATLFLWGMTIALTLLGAFEVHSRASETREAGEALLTAIAEESTVLEDLALLGSPTVNVQQLTALYHAVSGSKPGVARQQAAAAYILAVEAETQALFDARVRPELTRVRARNLTQAWLRYRSARTRWHSATLWPHGWLATRVGLAPPPPVF